VHGQGRLGKAACAGGKHCVAGGAAVDGAVIVSLSGLTAAADHNTGMLTSAFHKLLYHTPQLLTGMRMHCAVHASVCRMLFKHISHLWLLCSRACAEANLLSYLATAKPLVTSTPEATGFCLHSFNYGQLAVKPCMPSNAANPSWRYDASTSQITLKGSSSPSLCLSGPGREVIGARVPVLACQTRAKEQEWQLTAGRQLRSASGSCMGLSATGDGEVVTVPCGSASEAVWSFGGERAAHLASCMYSVVELNTPASSRNSPCTVGAACDTGQYTASW
jgi:hypothetical protein